MLSCNKELAYRSERRVAKIKAKKKDLGYSVVGDGFHLRRWDSHRHAEVNAESLSEY